MIFSLVAQETNWKSSRRPAEINSSEESNPILILLGQGNIRH
jgi:hypothetical protein